MEEAGFDYDDLASLLGAVMSSIFIHSLFKCLFELIIWWYKNCLRRPDGQLRLTPDWSGGVWAGSQYCTWSQDREMVPPGGDTSRVFIHSLWFVLVVVPQDESGANQTLRDVMWTNRDLVFVVMNWGDRSNWCKRVGLFETVQVWTVTSTWSASETSSVRTSDARSPPLSSGTIWGPCTTCRLWWGHTHTHTMCLRLAFWGLYLTLCVSVCVCVCLCRVAARVGDFTISKHGEEFLSAWWHHPGSERRWDVMSCLTSLTLGSFSDITQQHRQ